MYDKTPYTSLFAAMSVREIIESDPLGDMCASYLSPVMMMANGAHVSPATGDGRPVRTPFFQTLFDHKEETLPLHLTMTTFPARYALAVMPSTVACLSRVVDTENQTMDFQPCQPVTLRVFSHACVSPKRSNMRARSSGFAFVPMHMYRQFSNKLIGLNDEPIPQIRPNVLTGMLSRLVTSVRIALFILFMFTESRDGR